MLTKILRLVREWACLRWGRRAYSNRAERRLDLTEGHSGRNDSNVQGNPTEIPVNYDQATPDDELTDASRVDHDRQVTTASEPDTPGSNGLDDPSLDPPEETTPYWDPPPTRPAKDLGPSKTSSATTIPELPEESPDVVPGGDSEQKAPSSHGGRRSRSVRNGSPPKKRNTNSEKRAQFTHRPELICRKPRGSRTWEVILSAGDKCKIAEVLRGGLTLAVANHEYHLSSFVGSLAIAYVDGKQDEIPLFPGKPMVFKSRNNWVGDGRRVRGITSGYFIVVAPKQWKRKGPAPVAPEPCTDSDFRAHFFYLPRGAPHGVVDGFEECRVALIQSGFNLVGDRVFDDLTDGELFVGGVPELHCADGVVWARVGEEGKEGWKGENFKPVERPLADVLGSRQGRFFVRTYDGESKLLDSSEFRYLSSLTGIRVNGEPYSANTLLMPLSMGHSPTEVRFAGTDGNTIHPMLATGSDEAHATVQPGGAVIVAPDPHGDEIHCALETSAGCVETVINLPRVWWRLERDDGESDGWRGVNVNMTRQEFLQYADTDAKVQLRLPQRISSVGVGFGDELGREYPSLNSDRNAICTIPLAEFRDYLQIDQRSGSITSLNVRCEQAVLTLILISADPVLEISSFTSDPAQVVAGETATLKWITRNAESCGAAIEPGIGPVDPSGSTAVALNETVTFTLRLTASDMDALTRELTLRVRSQRWPGKRPGARVKRTGGGWRLGKGFSCSEIDAAGLTNAEAMGRSIPIDRRRRSTHQANIEIIASMNDA